MTIYIKKVASVYTKKFTGMVESGKVVSSAQLHDWHKETIIEYIQFLNEVLDAISQTEE